jgi:ferredoxin
MAVIVIKPEGIRAEVGGGYALRRLDREHPSSVFFGCRDGTCGRCLVRVVEGASYLKEVGEKERTLLRAMEGRPEERLACFCQLTDTEGAYVVIENVSAEGDEEE